MFHPTWRSWKITVGRDPRRVAGPALILFPLRPSRLCCGLAGILALKREEQEPPDRFSSLSGHFMELRGAERQDADRNGRPPALVIGEMEKILYQIKQDADEQFRWHRNGGLDRWRNLADSMEDFVRTEEAALEKDASGCSTQELERSSQCLIRIKDIAWGLREDLLKNQEKILHLAGDPCADSPAVFRKYLRLNQLLNSLDRLEVRGRDSTGIQVTLEFPAREEEEILRAVSDPGQIEEFRRRTREGDLADDSISLFPGGVTFTYKTASITGELGKNCRALRDRIRRDDLFREFVSRAGDRDRYLAHTRWASVGAITISNCHPVNHFTLPAEGSASWPVRHYPRYGTGRWFIHAALNGDIDNYQALKSEAEAAGRLVDQRVTTDTKVIPLQIEKYLLEGQDLAAAFRLALNDFEGSHAIAMESSLEPGQTFLALRGSGQALFVGLAENQYSFASEVYGLIEETPCFLKMNGESPRPDGPAESRGQIFRLHSGRGGGLQDIEACHYDGFPLELGPTAIQKAEITTRDIDRRGFRHYLLKEILDAPDSIRKTLRGKYRISDRRVVFNFGEDVFPESIARALKEGRTENIFVIGQGTAAVAGAAVAEALSHYLQGARLRIQAQKASDLSGFAGRDELSRSLVLAVTQSGTTTDTNRAVALARESGAGVIAIVNRRQSDITTKAHGVLYTSDGRDIEMSVASSKAFYSQIVAGQVLALYLAQLLGTCPDDRLVEALRHLEKTPAWMGRVIGQREDIRQAAWEVVRRKRYWAVVGSGANKVAADEIRIKLSELCYKTISSDIIEDKKHIDLSSEPLVLVLAAGSPDVVKEDIVKDTAIFKAHSARAVVVADEGESRFDAVADHVIRVPRAPFPVSILMNALAGHLWGYFAACSLDEQSGRFKEFRTRLGEMVSAHRLRGLTFYESIGSAELKRLVGPFSAEFHSWRSEGCLTAMHVETAAELTLLLKYLQGKLPVEDFAEDFRGGSFPASPLETMDMVLGRAMDEFSRPIDAIRHQAKTVTVGTSRKAEKLRGVLFDALAGCGFSQENLAARDILHLKRLQPAVQSILGYTLYRLEGLDPEGKPAEDTTISIVRRGGISENMPSRVAGRAPLLGTKRTIARTGEIYAGSGKSDDASILILPLRRPPRLLDHLLLLHVAFNEALSFLQKRELLDEKYWDIRNLMNEKNRAWNDEFLAGLSVKTLLGEAVEILVERISPQPERT